MNVGIYAIINIANGKRYIGSAVNIRSRLEAHRNALRANRNSRHFQNAWNKYGEDVFVFEPLLRCDKEDLLFYEQRAIDVYQSSDRRHGYNLSPTAGNSLGVKYTEETKRKMSRAFKGRVHSDASRQKISRALKGRILSDTTKQKMSEAGMGHMISEKTRRKISQTLKGRPLSEETKRKLSEAHKGIVPWNKDKIGVYSEEAIRRMSETKKGNTAFLGKKHTEVTKKNISIAAKGRSR